ncbi:hypothetical protein M404DRAFT_527304 [Pisolithus tinctorius Marx 270]|uniref:Uncharacterized protein n=1 Tax=Pisolithus tinctorius Marx 270 TaxID=870435 RepID=A0A0C3NX41_PISTI|nr:hypothetical protein M404DRAFT_527304 [Pisolithus tinctorius Marx 270]
MCHTALRSRSVPMSHPHPMLNPSYPHSTPRLTHLNSSTLPSVLELMVRRSSLEVRSWSEES